MNLHQAIKRHEDKAAQYARLGKAKRASAELRRANELRTAKRIRKELRQ